MESVFFKKVILPVIMIFGVVAFAVIVWSFLIHLF